MRQIKIGWLVVCAWLSVSCSLTAIELPPTLAAPVTITAVSPTTTSPPTAVTKPTAQPLPATKIPAATETAVIDQTPTKISDSQTTPSPTPTFAAFGITQTIGLSVGQRPIVSHRFGFGSQTIILVGGMHGGYEWNSIALAYEMIDYFLTHPDDIPANISLYIIPSANPDGQYLVTGTNGRFSPQDVSTNTQPGRFNANQVDLNRNWDCEWQAEAVWGSTVVSGGSNPFSEPETAALATFFLREKPEVVLFWHSKADGIFAGGCGDPHPASLAISQLYGDASGYRVFESFTAYVVSGDASDWLTTQNIPSFTVELKTRSQTDWTENLAGVLGLLGHYGR